MKYDLRSTSLKFLEEISNSNPEISIRYCETTVLTYREFYRIRIELNAGRKEVKTVDNFIKSCSSVLLFIRFLVGSFSYSSVLMTPTKVAPDEAPERRGSVYELLIYTQKSMTNPSIRGIDLRRKPEVESVKRQKPATVRKSLVLTAKEDSYVSDWADTLGISDQDVLRRALDLARFIRENIAGYDLVLVPREPNKQAKQVWLPSDFILGEG